MNTATFQETQAIATGSTAAAMAASQELLLIPLSKLRPSSRNVRKSGGTSIPELASSIARVGLLQNLTVVAAPMASITRWWPGGGALQRSSCWSSAASWRKSVRSIACWCRTMQRAP